VIFTAALGVMALLASSRGKRAKEEE